MAKFTVKGVKFRKIETGGQFVKWEKAGQTLIGKIIKSEIKKGQYGKQQVYTIETENGAVLISGSLIHNALKDVKQGTLIKIVFKGQTKAKNSKNKFNNFDIFIAD